MSCKLVCIAFGTLRPGINHLGDIVDIKPANWLPGPAEAPPSFTIVAITSPSIKNPRDAEAALAKLLPTDADADWAEDVTPEQQKYIWPKYWFRMIDPNGGSIPASCITNVVSK